MRSFPLKKLLILVVARAVLAKIGKIKWTDGRSLFAPAGFRVEQATTLHPWFYDHPEEGTPLGLHTKRFISQNSSQNERRRHFWLLAGGPGADASVLEEEFVKNYAAVFPNDTAIYVPHHRGTLHSSALPTKKSFGDTMMEIERLAKQSTVPLAAMSSVEAAMDVASLIESVSAECGGEHYMHGLSYGAHWAVQVGAMLDRTGLANLVKGIVVDSGLAPGFKFNRHYSIAPAIHALVANLERDSIASRLSDRSTIFRGVQNLANDSSDCPCVKTFKSTFTSFHSFSTLHLGQQLIQSFFEQELVFFVTDRDPKGQPVDLRVLMIQMLSGLGECRDPAAFSWLLYFVGYVYSKLEPKESPEKPTGFFSGARRIRLDDAVTRNGYFDLDAFKSFVTKQSQVHIVHTVSPRGSQSDIDWNFMLFANIVYSEFWDHSLPSCLDQNLLPPSLASSSSAGSHLHSDSTWAFLAPKRSAILEYYARDFRPLLSTRHAQPVMPSPSSPIKYLILAGDLDPRAPSKISRDFFDRLSSQLNKQLFRFSNRGHIVASLSDECSRCLIRSFVSLPSDQPIPRSSCTCVEDENKGALDWLQPPLASAGLFSWSTVGRPFWLSVYIKVLVFISVCPFWWLIPISMLVVIVAVVFFVRRVLRLYRSRRSTSCV